MTLWKNLVVALVAAFVLAACSSSDNDPAPTDTGMEQTGPTQAELDAAEKDKAEAEAEAEAQKKRADELQAEKERDQAVEDRDVAKALFKALRNPLAPLDSDPRARGGSTIDVASIDGRTINVVIPRVSMADGMSSVENVAGESFTVSIASTKGPNTAASFAEKYATANAAPTAEEPIQYGANRTATLLTGSAVPLAKSPKFPQKSGTINYPAGDKRQFGGTYDGADGMYVCEGDTCSAKYTEDGVQLTGTWTFVHVPGARTSTADDGFLSYGWWLQKNDKDEIVDVGPVFYTKGGEAIDSTQFAALEGTATYEGAATGKYAIYSGAFSNRSEAGHFTAHAMLTADFAEEASGSIEGTISKFMTAAGPKDGWMVHLGSTVLGDSGVTDTLGMATWEIGGIKSDAKGAYFARLFDQGADDVPKEVGGYFEVPFEGGVGEMIGAFAAGLDE